MGILDEAIREHLELKRQRGATDSELQRLEDEAFGPPSRPGEPDFPEQPAEQSGNGVAHEGDGAESPAAAEAPIAPHSEGEHAEAEPPSRLLRRLPAEPPSGEGPQADSSSEPAEPPSDEPPSGPEEETAIYDHTVDADPELEDLDLELTEEGPAPDEPPIETLDTVEHTLPEQDATPRAPPSEEPTPSPPRSSSPVSRSQGRRPRRTRRQPRARPKTRRTCSPTRLSSSRTLPKTTSCGSSRASPRISISRLL